MLDGRCLLVRNLFSSLLSVGFPVHTYKRGCQGLVRAQKKVEPGGGTDSLGSAGLIILLTAPNALVFLAFDPPLPPFLDLAISALESGGGGGGERREGVRGGREGESWRRGRRTGRETSK